MSCLYARSCGLVTLNVNLSDHVGPYTTRNIFRVVEAYVIGKINV